MSPYSSESDKSASGAGAREAFLRLDRLLFDEWLELLRSELWLLRREWALDRGKTFIPFSVSEEWEPAEPSEDEDPSASGAVLLVSFVAFLTPLIPFGLPFNLKCIRGLHLKDTPLLARLFVVSIMVCCTVEPSPRGDEKNLDRGPIVGRTSWCCAIVTKRPNASRYDFPNHFSRQGLFYLIYSQKDIYWYNTGLSTVGIFCLFQKISRHNFRYVQNYFCELFRAFPCFDSSTGVLGDVAVCVVVVVNSFWLPNIQHVSSPSGMCTTTRSYMSTQHKRTFAAQTTSPTFSSLWCVTVAIFFEATPYRSWSANAMPNQSKQELRTGP